MTIPVSTVVDVDIVVGADAPARKGFGILNLVTNDTSVIGIAERIRAYSNLEGVEADWPVDSEVVKVATTYFSQSPKPSSLKVSVRYDSDQAAQLRGGSVVDPTPFLSIADGSFTISIDGSSQDISSLDFTDGEVTLDDIATSIQTALQAVATGGFTSATCIHDGSRFFITSGTTGGTSTISFTTPTGSGTDISSLLQMAQGEGTKTNGINAEKVSESLAAIDDISQDWYGFMFTKEVRDLVQINGELSVEAASDWAQSKVKAFFNTSNDLDVLDAVTTTDIISVLNDKDNGRTMNIFSSYPNEYPSASMAGRAFTVDFTQPDSTITLKFKQAPGITPEALTQSQKSVLDSKRGNAIILVGDNPMFAESYTAGQLFFDELHGIDWLQNAVETAVFSHLYTKSTKVPGTDKGVAELEQEMIKVFEEAKSNGLISAGDSEEGEFLPFGYKITSTPIADRSEPDKLARLYKGTSFVVIGAGAIHGVQINGVFQR